MRGMVLLAGLIGLLATSALPAQPAPIPEMTAPDPTPPPPVDYSDPTHWMCRPGVDDGTCSANLDALVVPPTGDRTPAPYKAAKAPPIDCFYVYPTASTDPTMFSDLKPDREETRAVHGQAARLGAQCRLFVPIYHQFTAAALRYEMVSSLRAAKLPKIDFDIPYRDILAAWRDYLKRDNKGRGVVLVGHSQGAMILKRLIADEIDGKPAQKLLVGAYLAGNDDLTTDSFKSIKPCVAMGQTGCLTAWSSYRVDYQGRRIFGGAGSGKTAICVNPAAPGGGRGALKAYLPRPQLAPQSDPPYVEMLGQLTAECVTDGAGSVLRIRIEPTQYADVLDYVFGRYASASPGWGLHPLDISLVQGNMLDMIGAQATAWAKAH